MEKNSAVTLRKHKAGQSPEGNDALLLSDLYKLLQSVENRLSERLSVVEKSLMEHLQLAETSLEHAYNIISDLTSDLKAVKKELAAGSSPAGGGAVVPAPPFNVCSPHLIFGPPNYHEAVKMLCAVVDSRLAITLLVE